MSNIFIEVTKKYWSNGVVISIFLWMMLWGSYNADVSRIFITGFPHNFLDLLHGVRSLLPLCALLIAIFLVIKKHNRVSLNSPLAMFMLYSVVGLIASFLSKDFRTSFYWGILYLSVIVILFTVLFSKDKEKSASLIMWANFFMASFVALFLTIFFFLKPGVFSFETVHQFILGFRPYEGMANIPVEGDILGMVGSRATGFGRYAAVAAIICFAQLWRSSRVKTIIYSISFSLFSVILFFSRARTSVIAFIFAIFFISLWNIKEKLNFCFMIASIMIILSMTNFYNYFFIYLVPEVSVPVQVQLQEKITSGNNIFYNNNGKIISRAVDISKAPKEAQNTGTPDNNITTLSGRTSIWMQALPVFISSPLIGRGFQADRIFLSGLHAHNTWVQVLVQSGILGCIFFTTGFFMFLFYLVKFFKNYNNTLLSWCIGLSVFFIIRSITESFAFFGADWLFFAPVIAYVQFLNSEDSENYTEELAVSLLGKKINVIDMESTVKKINFWINKEPEKNHWITLCGMHGVVEGHKDHSFLKIINSSDLSLIDGMSLLFLGRMMGYKIKERVAGPDLMKEYLGRAEKEGQSVFFLGETEETMERLVLKISEVFPKLKIAGTLCPPFKEFTQEDNNIMTSAVNEKKPDILWIAFNLKKQEEWIYNNRKNIKVPVIIGVGAAFKFLGGMVKRAPKWVGNMGFEWLWRLFQEPKKTWKRVFIYIPYFVVLACKDRFLFIVAKLRATIKKILLIIEKYIFWPMKIIFGKKILKELVPYNVYGFEKKIRLGNKFDGGYVIPSKIIPLIGVAYCYGVADHVDFEDDLSTQTNIPFRFYDHTVDSLPSKNINYHFFKQGIANRKHSKLSTFAEHLKENGDNGKKVLVKMDIEGAEWGVLKDIVNNFSNNIVCLVIEIHQLYRYDNFPKYINILKKINSKFTLVHIHGNNNGETVSISGKIISSVLELTFINSNLSSGKSILPVALPSELDYPNIEGRDDIIIDFWIK